MAEIFEHKNTLILKAKEDLEAAKNLSKIDGFSEEIVLFHCQQAVEKALKAYLDSKAEIYPKSHDLETLLSLCIKKDSSFNQISYVTSLTPFAIEIRYDEFVQTPRDEIIKIIDQTETSLNFILSKIIIQK